MVINNIAIPLLLLIPQNRAIILRGWLRVNALGFVKKTISSESVLLHKPRTVVVDVGT